MTRDNVSPRVTTRHQDGASSAPATPACHRGLDKASVLVAGFRGAIGAGIREVIARDAFLAVIAAEEDDVTALVKRHRPDVALIDHEALSGIESVKQLVAHDSPVRVVIAVMRPNRERDARLLAAGVDVVVPLTVEAGELCALLRLVARGVIAPASRARMQPNAGTGLLTKRELEVMELLIRRRSAREIAAELHVSEATVNTHRRHVYEKLGVHSRGELAVHAQRLLSFDDGLAPMRSRERAAFRRHRLTSGEFHRPGFSMHAARRLRTQ